MKKEIRTGRCTDFLKRNMCQISDDRFNGSELYISYIVDKIRIVA